MEMEESEKNETLDESRPEIDPNVSADTDPNPLIVRIGLCRKLTFYSSGNHVLRLPQIMVREKARLSFFGKQEA